MGERVTEQRAHWIGDYELEGYESLLVPPPSVRTGFWPTLDELVGGFRPNEYTILSGPTGSGKSAWLAALTEGVARQGTPVFVASVENGPVDFFRRIVSARQGRNWNEGDTIPVHEVDRFRRNNPDIVNLPILVSTFEDRVSNDEMMLEVRKAAESGCKVAILDNLNFFLDATTQANAVMEMDRVTHDWIILAKQLPLHVIMVMHPRKTDGGRVVSEYDIKGSSTSVQEAHNVLLLNRLGEKEQEEYAHAENYRELKIAKCRRKGRATGKVVSFYSQDGATYREQTPKKPVGGSGYGLVGAYGHD